MNTTIDNTQDIIDSRDIIARIEELETELQAAQEGVGGPESAQGFDEWLAETATYSEHVMQDAAQELIELRELASECGGYGDWAHGEALIRESYFTEYAQELAEDIGAVGKDQQWPLCHIDWEGAADALKADYMEVSFSGVTYLMRA